MISSFQETCSGIESVTYEMFLDHLGHTFGNDWIVLEALKGRIGIHHSLIPKYIQKENYKFYLIQGYYYVSFQLRLSQKA